MSALASLARAYDRMATRGEVPAFGYATQGVGFLISLESDGKPAGPPIDIRQIQGRKLVPQLISVPQPVKRTVAILPNFLWDKSAYVLGITAGDGKRTAAEHAAFKSCHEVWLAGTEDEGLLALLRFIEDWTADAFAALGWPDEMRDQNIVFALERERLNGVMLHDREEARSRRARIVAAGEGHLATCLVTGERGPVQRLHPSIKGVWGAQTSGASIISFNCNAFTSYGHEQGDNAPVSEVATFAYTTAINRLLQRESGHRLQVGDASTVFWADAAEADRASQAEAFFGGLLGAVDEAAEARKIESVFDRLRQGQLLENPRPRLPQGVRFHVLALAPNAARLSVRFYVEDDFGSIVERYLAHLERLRVEPSPREAAPSIWRQLIETAVLRKSENIQPKLAGDWLRAILTGAPYPLTLLSSVVMRIRADGEINAIRAGLLKAVLIRNFRMEVPVALDLENRDQGYLLGRLFAAYERAQEAALGRDVNATIKDKFYGSASAQPRKVFALLDRGSANHLSKIGKKNPGQKVNLERLIAGIMDVMAPSADPFPASLPEKSQALFALGYYHQRSAFFAAKPATEDPIRAHTS